MNKVEIKGTVYSFGISSAEIEICLKTMRMTMRFALTAAMVISLTARTDFAGVWDVVMNFNYRTMNKQKPTYRFTIKANNRPIKHFVNREDYGFYIPACADNDEKMRDHARGMHIALAGVYKKPSVEVYCLDEIGEYRLISKFE